MYQKLVDVVDPTTLLRYFIILRNHPFPYNFLYLGSPPKGLQLIGPTMTLFDQITLLDSLKLILLLKPNFLFGVHFFSKNRFASRIALL